MNQLPFYLTRRRALHTALALATLPCAVAAAAEFRVATLDWAILETLLAIKANVVAATELVQFRQIAVEPPVPAAVVDLGLRGTANFEALRLAAPTLIFNSNFYISAEARLRQIAPVERFSIFVPGEPPFGRAEAMTRSIGDRLGRTDAAAVLCDQVHSALAERRQRINGAGGRPVLLINFGDARHFRVFGADSMFGEAATQLGLNNAWQAPTSYSAMAPIGLEALARFADAWLVVLGPHPADAAAILPHSRFWNLLPNVQAGRVLMLPAINPFGALPSVERFTRLLTDALSSAQKAA